MTVSVELDRIAEYIREIAAVEIMPRFRKLAKSDIKHKGDWGDFATTADLEAERALGVWLKDRLPGSRVVGEEAAAKSPELLDLIAGETPVWIVDPLDGTHNFADGIEHFCVILALTQAGETRAAWIHDPIADRTVVAERGGGTWEAGKQLRVAAPAAIAEMRGAIYAKAGRPGVSQNLESVRGKFAATVNRRCAGCEYLSLARGESHFTLFSRLFPWDHAGGALIHAEAGGYNACWDGTPYRPTRHAGGILLAPDAPSWRAIAALTLA
ncbi:MAG TPA: inositol monophosphatase family protein [Alphaproteobacteria bacterium]|nr:inositol monophosphatase family protein [Alphaproteobacteria bacterium]